MEMRGFDAILPSQTVISANSESGSMLLVKIVIVNQGHGTSTDCIPLDKDSQPVLVAVSEPSFR